MALNFPSSPATNQVYTDATSGKSWTFNGTAWDQTTGNTVTTGNGLTLSSGGAGAASGTTFNGSAAVTISYNSIGAASLGANTFTGAQTINGTANNIILSGANTGSPVTIQAAGFDSNIDVNVITKGTGKFLVNGAQVQGGGSLTAATTPPSTPTSGAEWFNTNTGILYIWVDDGTSAQWVDMDNSGGTTGNFATLSNSFTIGDSLAGTKQLNFTSNTGIVALTSTATAARTLNIPDDDGTIATHNNLGLRNRIMNGKMEIAQRGTSINVPATGVLYTLDRWRVANSTDGAFTVTQSTDAPTGDYQNSLRATVTTADTSIAAGQYGFIEQFIEGYNVRDLVGRTCTLTFWVRSPKTGTHCVAFRCSGGDLSYVAPYTVNAANTWEVKTIVMTSGLQNTLGTWNFTTGVGLDITWALACGSTFTTATTGTWTSGNFLATTAPVNCLDTVGNIFAITGVQLELGSVYTRFDHRPRGLELSLCQRYYELTSGYYVSYASSAAALQRTWLPFKVSKRTASPSCVPTITTGGLTAPSIVAARQDGAVVGFGATGASIESEFNLTIDSEL